MNQRPLLLLAGAAALAVGAAALSLGAAAVEIAVADALSPDPAEQRIFTLAARGVQIDECRAAGACAAVGHALRVPDTADHRFYDRSQP